MPATKKITALSLFSGMGGDTLGMSELKINIKGYSEFKEAFQKTHDLNFPKSVMLGKDVKSDISKIKDEEFQKYKNIDIVFAGFPCQSFSTGGKRKVNDPRNTMFREFVRAAKHTNAKVIIGENVKGLLTKKTETGELYIDIIIEEFKKLGYEVIYKVFKCHEYGVPQRRERLIILGIKPEYFNKFKLEFPEEDTPKNRLVGLQNIIKFSMEGTMKVTDDIYDFSTIPKECIIRDMDNEEEEHGAHPYLKMKRDIENKSYGEKDFTSLFSFGKRDSPIHCEIIDIRKPSKTIICTYDHQPRLFVPIQNKNGNYLRMLLPDELKQIQSFPEDYKLCGNKKEQIIQIGNAVPPLLIKKIVGHVLGK
jgi:DNA (cytosine-5)-methyltransferase 1